MKQTLIIPSDIGEATVSSLGKRDSFSYGLRIGAMLMCEIFAGAEKPRA